jgi:hypothetical protein
MGLDLTAFDSVLKTVFARQLVDLLNSDVKLYSKFQKADKETWEGRDHIEYPLRVGRNEGFAFGRPRGPIAEAQSQQYVPFKVPLRYGWGRINLDAAVIKVSKTNRGSFKRALQSEMDGLREDFTDDLNRIMFADGRGVLALVNVAGVGTTALTVDSPGGVAGTVNGARFLQVGQKIAILNAAGTAVTAVRTVSSIANDGNSVTLAAAVSAAQAPDNGFIVRAPNLNVTDVADVSFNLEPMGLLGMDDDGTFVNNYFNVNRTTYPIMKSSVLSSVGALNLDVMQQGFDVAAQIGRGSPTEIWCHHSVRRSYLALLVANRRYLSTGGANSHDGGFAGKALSDAVEFSGVPLNVDKDAPYGTMFGMDFDGAINFENTPGEWVDEDGAVLSRLHGSDVFEAVWRCFLNFAHEKPNKCFRLDGINSNIVIAHIV